MEKLLCPTQRVRWIIPGRSEFGKFFFLTSLVSNCIDEFEKKYTYSPILNEYLYHKINKWFSNDKPIDVISNFLNEEHIDLVIEEEANDKNFKQSDTEIELYESVERLRHLQDYEDAGINILQVLNEKVRLILKNKLLTNDVDIKTHLT